jgi:hypothetical protein
MGVPSKIWSKHNFRARGYGGSVKENRDEEVPFFG